jgi:hypothetical protein
LYLWTDGHPHITANLTVYAEDGQRIISMERFAEMLRFVECGDKMILSFHLESAFRYAVDAWKWLEEQENHGFLMIANHPRCSPDSQRRPYYISGFDYVEHTHTVYLHATRRSWNEAAHTFNLDVGQSMSSSQLSGLHRRDQVDSSVTWDISGTFEHDLITVNASGIDVGLTCNSCGVSGSINVGWHIVYQNSIPQDIIIYVQPEQLIASMILGLSITGASLTDPFEKNVALSVPITGLDILNIAHLGPTFDLTFGLSVGEFTGTLTTSFGLNATLPNNAPLKLDLLNPGNSVLPNWVPILDPAPLDVQGEVSANFDAFIQEAFGVDVTVLGR